MGLCKRKLLKGRSGEIGVPNLDCVINPQSHVHSKSTELLELAYIGCDQLYRSFVECSTL